MTPKMVTPLLMFAALRLLSLQVFVAQDVPLVLPVRSVTVRPLDVRYSAVDLLRFSVVPVSVSCDGKQLDL